jgi:hypothetical protein
MPKIQQVARFTTRVKPTDPFYQSLAPKEETVMQEPQAAALTKFASQMLELMQNQTQPLSVTEITEMIAQELDHRYHDSHVRIALNELVEKNKLFTRDETSDERSLRASGQKIRNIRAALYSIQNPVQARTEAEAVPGIFLSDSWGVPWSKKKAARAKDQEVILEDVTPVSIPAGAMSNPVVDMLIEKIVAERTKEMAAELEKVQTELARLKEFLKSAL